MNQEAKELKAFMDAIARDPRDVKTRQVFADWLDDHDEPELAQQQRNFNLIKYNAEQELRKLADRYADGDYEGLLEGFSSGDGYCFSDDDGPYNAREMWTLVEIITDTEYDEDHRESTPFRCAC